MEINIEVSGFLSSDKKILKMSNFELLFIKRNPKTNTSNIEMRCHIKYINLRDRNNTKIIMERKDQNEKYTIKTSSTEDMDNLISTLSKEQLKYKLFIKDYYNDNNSYNLIEGDSFFDYFTSIKDFLQTFIRNIDLIFINPELEKLLDLINTLLVKIDYYLGVINSNENKLKEQNETIYLESNEIKQLLLNLKEAINSCSLGVECQENKNEIFESKEEELTKVLLENESLKMQNENLINENQIISQFLNDNKNKK